MGDDAMRARLRQVSDAVRSAFPTMVEDVRAELGVDSDGAEIVRVRVTLQDPPGGGGLALADVAPIDRYITAQTADIEAFVHADYFLASELREIEAGTYYG